MTFRGKIWLLLQLKCRPCHCTASCGRDIITWYIHSPESCNWFYLVLFSHKWMGSKLVMVEPPIVLKFGSAKLNTKISYCLFEPFDVFFFLSISVQCPPQSWGLILCFYSFSLILPTINFIVSRFLPKALYAHLHSQIRVWAPFVSPTCTIFFFFLSVCGDFKHSGLDFPAGNSRAKKGLLFITSMVNGKELPLEPILLGRNHWPSEKSWRTEEETQSRGRRWWICRGVKRENAWVTDNEMAAKKRGFYYMN